MSMETCGVLWYSFKAVQMEKVTDIRRIDVHRMCSYTCLFHALRLAEAVTFGTWPAYCI